LEADDGGDRPLQSHPFQHLNSRYDAYGTKTGETGNVDNKYLFAGEQFDEDLGDYYLRARYYDTDAGRFTRRDSHEGSLGQPLTLHKYVYGNNNPIRFTDPRGLYSSDDGYSVEDAVEAAYMLERPYEALHTTFGNWARGRGYLPFDYLNIIRPDILNFAGFASGLGFGLYNEIKPLSLNGIAKGSAQMMANEIYLDPWGFEPDVLWHSPLNPLLLKQVNIGGKVKPIMVFNAFGILFYTDDLNLKQKVKQMVYSSSYEAQQKVRDLLLTSSNSAINELGKSKYLIESAGSTINQVNFALLAAMVTTAAATWRYA